MVLTKGKMMKKKTNRRRQVKQTPEQLAMTCTTAKQAHRISPEVFQEYMKLHLDQAVAEGVVREVKKEKKDDSIHIEHRGFPDGNIGNI